MIGNYTTCVCFREANRPKGMASLEMLPVLGTLPDDIEKGGIVIFFLKSELFHIQHKFIFKTGTVSALKYSENS